MKALCLLLISLLLNLTSAFAEGKSPNENFRPLSRKHVEMALEQGYEKIGKLNLNKLLKELDTVEWRTFDLGFLTGSGGKRTTSIYLVKDNMVVINMYALQNLVGKPIPLYSWSLHEALGALGYEDENYEVSSSISFLANNKSPGIEDLTSIDFVKHNFDSFKRSKKERVYEMSGGSTVVGGGGDAALIQLKQLLLKRYLTWVKEVKPEATPAEIKRGFSLITKMKIEFNLEHNNYNSTEFSLKDNELYIEAGAQISVEVIYAPEYIDAILGKM
jgi:hypothetical protein